LVGAPARQPNLDRASRKSDGGAAEGSTKEPREITLGLSVAVGHRTTSSTDKIASPEIFTETDRMCEHGFYHKIIECIICIKYDRTLRVQSDVERSGTLVADGGMRHFDVVYVVVRRPGQDARSFDVELCQEVLRMWEHHRHV